MGRLNLIFQKRRLKALPFVLIALLGLATSGLVFSEEDHDRAKILKERGQIRPLTEIIDKVRTKHSGEIIEVELEEEEGKIIYELELLDEDGVVTELKYDAKTGVLLTTEVEDED